MNPFDYDPAYPRNPSTLAEYIRKWRTDKGISQVSFAERIGVNETTIVNWDIRGMVPRVGRGPERTSRRDVVPSDGNTVFLEIITKAHDPAKSELPLPITSFLTLEQIRKEFK